MITLAFYLGALSLFGLGALCIRNTSVRTASGGPEYVATRRRRVVGILLMIAAAMSLATGLTSQISSGNATPSVPGSDTTSTGRAQVALVSTNLATPIPLLPATRVNQPESGPGPALLSAATRLLRQNRYQTALHEVNLALRADPGNPAAYALRGNIFATKKLWSQAEADYGMAIRFDGANLPIKFDLGQIEFAQKKYTAARPLFAAAQPDSDIGDLAQYEVFLCDLLGGHEDVAARELDDFNQAGSNASYYFANAAWSLRHHDKAKARSWLTSAGYIFAPYKFKLYADNLIGLADAEAAPSPAQ